MTFGELIRRNPEHMAELQKLLKLGIAKSQTGHPTAAQFRREAVEFADGIDIMVRWRNCFPSVTYIPTLLDITVALLQHDFGSVDPVTVARREVRTYFDTEVALQIRAEISNIFDSLPTLSNVQMRKAVVCIAMNRAGSVLKDKQVREDIRYILAGIEEEKRVRNNKNKERGH